MNCILVFWELSLELAYLNVLRLQCSNVLLYSVRPDWFEYSFVDVYREF
jgi:preprotein translocase subunit Sss1